MISILLYVATVAFLASSSPSIVPTVGAQQAKVVYEQHFIENPEPPQHHSQNHNHNSPQARQIPVEYLHPFPNYHNSPEYVPEQSNNAIHSQQSQSNDGSHNNLNNHAQFQQDDPNQYPNQQQQFHQQSENFALFAPISSINNNQIQHQSHPNQPQQQHQSHQNQLQQQYHQQQQPLVQQGFMHHNHKAIGMPINRNGFPYGPPPNLPPGAIPVPIPASQFHARRGGVGPINKMMKGAQRFAPRPGNTRRRNGGNSPIRMNEMQRLPKPPKYPLYDMPEVGMATPPPPPLMHPMSLTAMATSMYPSFALPGKRGRKNRRRPKHPPLSHNPRKPQRSGKKRPHPHGPHHGHHGGQSHGKNNQHQQGHHPNTNYEHTMASSMDPQVSSPPLGRPLTYDEYMQRPSHSFTDDPWNFDPQAVNYNSGMNTFAMKYNYDPLGMNSLDKEQSHLDPDSLSYPGDTHVMQDSSNAASTSQIGGWDMKPETYRTQQQPSSLVDTRDLTSSASSIQSDMSTSLQPPPIKSSSSSWNNNNPIHNQYDITYNSGLKRNEPLNSFNIYDQSSDASSRSNAMLKSDMLNLDPLKILSDANPGIEFTVESSSNGDGVGTSYSSNNNNNDNFHQENQYTWNQYPQKSHLVYNYDPENIPSVADNDPALSMPQNKEYLQQLRQASKYENGLYDTKTKLHTMALAQDYIARDKPISDLSDNYNPFGSSGSGLSTGLLPPTETAAMFKRQGVPAAPAAATSRTTRGDKVPLVELEGLSLLNDILKSQQSSGTRKQLYSILTM